MARRVQPVAQEAPEHLMMELDAILDRISGLLSILAEEIAVFNYFIEKYRLWDPDEE